MILALFIAGPATNLAQQLADPLRDRPILVLGVLETCLAVAFLALWWAARDYRVFAWMGLYFSIAGLQQFWRYFAGVEYDWLFTVFSAPIIVLTAASALQITRYRWTWLLFPVYAFNLVAGFVPALAFAHTWSVDVSQIAIGVFIVKAFRRSNSELRWVAAAFTVWFLVRCTVSDEFRAWTHLPRYLEIGNSRWYFTTPTMVLMGTVTLVVYVRALIEDRREKQRLAGELDAARAVQQILVPANIPQIPGCKFDAVYMPFGEVGGDFFQIVPVGSQSVLAVIGDVSGKGMPAAMAVSLLVGTFRTLTRYTQSPGEILTAMNQLMTGRNSGGFTTCLVLRIDADGTLTAANAGHLAPYLDGNELALQNGMPLGLPSESSYAETTLRLPPGASLTLLTDGVIEARNSVGELFGFDRTAAIATQDARQIAHAAKQFGQDDDITVLTLAFAPATH
jgi:hypothetical protein